MFVLKKVLTALLLPLSAALLLLLLATALLLVGRRHAAAVLLVVATGGLWMVSTPAVSSWLRFTLEQRYPARPLAEAPEVDAIVVLGGGLSPAEPPRQWPDLHAAADRVLHGARLYRAGRAPLVVVTGGTALGGTMPQAAAAAELLQELGVPAEAILRADESRTTYEDATEARELLAAHDVDSLLLVTSALHMPRALATFRASGLPAVPSATDFEVTPADAAGPLAWIPDPESLHGSSRAVRELLGCVGYAWRGWIPSPWACASPDGRSVADAPAKR